MLPAFRSICIVQVQKRGFKTESDTAGVGQYPIHAEVDSYDFFIYVMLSEERLMTLILQFHAGTNLYRREPCTGTMDMTVIN